MADIGNFLERAIDLGKQATEADNIKEYEKAKELYVQSIEYFSLAIKYEKNGTSKQMLRAKAFEYMQRAEQLKEHISRNPVISSEGGAASATRRPKDDDDKGEEDEEEKRLKNALESAIVSETPDVKWSDVAGLEMAKEALQEAVIMPLKFPHLFTGKRTPWRGILLYGPPGTGKSFLAKAVATEAKSTFFSVSSSDLISKWLGESERLVRSLFEMARNRRPSIVFIDEIDALCGSRGETEHESSRRVKTEFLVQMQGVAKDMEGVLVLAATNLPWVLDAGIRRRFERRIYIPLPSHSALTRLFELHVGDTQTDMTKNDWKNIADQCLGYSGSDINVVVREALMAPVRRVQNATHFVKVRGPDRANPSIQRDYLTPCSPGAPGAIEMSWTDLQSDELLEPPVRRNDFENAIRLIKSSVSEDDLKEHEEFTAQFGSSDV